jgi:hypothetical protein
MKVISTRLHRDRRDSKRPRLREPHPVRPIAVLVGAVGGSLWLIAFGLLGTDLRSYVWWTSGAGASAWLAAILLTRYGDRGVAVGVAAATGMAWTAMTLSVTVQWIRLGAWPL